MPPSIASRGKSWTERMVRLGGLAALLGGVAWTVKGGVILAGGDQPPFLFEAAPGMFGLGLWGVTQVTLLQSRRRRVALALASVAGVAGLVALLSDLVGQLWGVTLALSSVAQLMGLLTLPRNERWPAPLAWWIGAAMVPSLVIGGVLSEIDERLLEIPLVCLGIAWAALGWALLTNRRPA